MKTQNQITWPTEREQIDYWNKKEGEELERVSRIQEAESRDATNETRVAQLEAAMQDVLFVARGAADENNRCSICRIAQEALGLSHGKASTTAKTLTQEEIEEREQATCDWYDENARRYRLVDEGQTFDAEGESYAERNA